MHQLTHPVRIPSLIGVADRKYLDATGLIRYRSIGDLIRYAAINEGLDTLAWYGGFQPSSGATSFSGDAQTRYSDEQLYALVLYIESLRPPLTLTPTAPWLSMASRSLRRSAALGATPRRFT